MAAKSEPVRNWDVRFWAPDGTRLEAGLGESGRLDILASSPEPRPPWPGTDMPVIQRGDLVHIMTPRPGLEPVLRVTEVVVDQSPPPPVTAATRWAMTVYTEVARLGGLPARLVPADA